jgi:hypothetical protein
MNSRRLPILVVASMLCTLALAACGSSAKKPKTVSTARGPFMAYSVCVRSHGVPNFPDPAAGGGGIHLGDGFDPNSPSFKSAQTACQHLLPGGGPGSQKASKQAIAAAVKTSECMRTHGVTGFPDPIVSSDPQALNPANYGEIGDRGGVIIAIPKTIDVGSPAYRDAARACGFNG